MKSFVAIDFETANNHRSSICSMGLIFVENGEIVDNFYHLVKPSPHFYTRWNTEVHGIIKSDTIHDPTFPEVWQMIAGKIDNLPLVAHYSSFDESCLKAAHAFYDMPYPHYDFHCTCRTARKKYPQLPNHQLHTVSAHVGFELLNHHHALADALACAHIALEVF